MNAKGFDLNAKNDLKF